MALDSRLDSVRPDPGTGWPTAPDTRDVDIHRYLRMARRRWWIGALMLIICVTSALGLSAQATRIYRAKARLFVGQQTIGRSDLPFAAALTATSLALVKSYSEAIRSRPIAESVVSKLGLPDDPSALLANIGAAQVGETQIIELGYRDPDPVKAQAVVNAFAESFEELIGSIDRLGTGEAGVSVSILEPAIVPRAPVSPQPVKNAAAGLLLGGALGWGLIVLMDRLDRSIKERSDAEEETNLPVLALVPTMPGTRGKIAVANANSTEAFHLLRNGIQFLGAENPIRIVAVTSPRSEDGKTTIAYNLARSFAQAGLTTVLVAADMRKPQHPRFFGASGTGSGLSSFLSSTSTLRGLVERSDVPKLFVIPPGTTPPSPAELLGSERMGQLLRALQKEADIVVVDTPPVLAVADALAMAPRMDAMLLVVRSGVTTRDQAREAVRVLGTVGAPLVGLILNGVKRSAGYYGYGYGYGQNGKRNSKSPRRHQPVKVDTAVDPSEVVSPTFETPPARNGTRPALERRERSHAVNVE